MVVFELKTQNCIIQFPKAHVYRIVNIGYRRRLRKIKKIKKARKRRRIKKTKKARKGKKERKERKRTMMMRSVHIDFFFFLILRAVWFIVW